jgi:hypothetical protein
MPKEKCLERFLDRDVAKEWITQSYSEALEFLRDMVCYGTSLIARAYESSEKRPCDVIVIFVLLKQVVAMLDAVEVLVSSGAILAANLQARAIMEASMFLGWILDSDTEKKAKHYYVADLRSSKLEGQRLLGGDTTLNRLMEEMEMGPIDVDEFQNSSSDGVKREMELIDKLLSSPEYSDVNRAFEYDPKGKPRKREPHWYQTCGAWTIREIAEQLRREMDYCVFYAKDSDIVHSKVLKHHIDLGLDSVNVKPIRNTGDIAALIKHSARLALVAYYNVLRFYRFGELSAFKKKIKEDWRPYFS